MATNGFPLALEGSSLKELSYVDLQFITDNLSPENFIGQTQFGELYIGRIEDQEVTVKIFREKPILCARMFHIPLEDRISRLKVFYRIIASKRGPYQDEITFLRQSIGQRHLPRLLGFCVEDEHLGVVYDLKTKGRLQDFISKDSFRWVDKIKAMNQVSHLLQFMHNYDPPYTVGSISSYHLLLDKDMNIVLVDFGMLTGGILGQATAAQYQRYLGVAGYVDGYAHFSGQWDPRADIYAYGVLLVELMSKKYMMDGGCESLVEPLRHCFFKGPPSFNLVDESMRSDPCYSDVDAEDITQTAVDCICYFRHRLTTDQVVHKLEGMSHRA